MSISDQNRAEIQPRKQPVQARSRARFERILDVAVELVVAKGVDAVAMSDIAGAAEISIASLYQYFPDKASIVATLADRYNAEGRQCVVEIFTAVNQPTDMIAAAHAMVDSYYEFFSAVPGAYAIWQATQSDKRLQAMDAEDMEFHAETVAGAFRVVKPALSKSEALRWGRLFTDIVSTVVRSATVMKPRDGRAMIKASKEIVLSPSIERALGLAESVAHSALIQP